MARRVAEDLSRGFAAGVRFVELAHLRDGTRLAETVAEGLGLMVPPGVAPSAALCGFLADKHVLLILDNCEQVVDATALLVDQLLGASPSLRVLATSREPLKVIGEALYELRPLAIPSRAARCEQLVHWDAVALFTDRARSVVAGFTITDDNRAVVVDICRQLEGIPLAIELAAVRLRALPPTMIRERLGDRLRLLTAGHRTAPTRQQTLRASLEWSFQLCSDVEQSLWAQLSVFADGFEIDAVEGICLLPSGGNDVLDVLTALVDKSIVSAHHESGAARFRMLEMVREFGLEVLTRSGESNALVERHSRWFADLAARSHTNWLGPQQFEWMRRLRRDHANLQAALSALADSGMSERGVQMAADLHFYWLAGGLFNTGRDWLRTMLGGQASATSRCRALHSANWLALMQGDADASKELLDELARTTEFDPYLGALRDQAAGLCALYLSNLDEASRLLRCAAARFSDSCDDVRLVETLLLLIVAAALGARVDDLARVKVRATSMVAVRGERWFHSYLLWADALVAWRGEQTPSSIALTVRSLAMKEGSSDRLGLALCLESLAWMNATCDRNEVAAAFLGAADRLWEPMATSTEALDGLHRNRAECENRVRKHLSAKAYDQAYADGRVSTLHETLALAQGARGRESGAGNDAASVRRQRAVSPLTAREYEVANLVAEGLTNRQIAESLVISRRTAETHVQQILTKLGVDSRTRIARWLYETGQMAP